jgi:hypothetical protein
MVFRHSLIGAGAVKKSPSPGAGFGHDVGKTRGRFRCDAQHCVVNFQLAAAFANEPAVGIVADQAGAKERARGIHRRQVGEQIESESAVGGVLLFNSRQRAGFRPMINALDAIHDPMAGGQSRAKVF